MIRRLASLGAIVACAVLLTAGTGRASVPPDAAVTSPSVPVFRVDVSAYPQIGLVVTVPAGRPLPGKDFRVTAGGRRAPVTVRRLSPDDVELAIAPDGGLPAAALAAQRAAVTAFLAGLPAGERTVAVAPDTPGVLAGRLSGDPAPALLAVGAVTARQRGSAAARLTTALSAFTAGSQVRRTIVLAVSASQPPSRAQTALLAARLAASGTALYVLDATPGGAAGYDALAAGSGGFAARVTTPASWAPALASIDASLAGQYYLRFTDKAALPGQVTVRVHTAAGTFRGIADLPAHNPVAPPLPPLAPRRALAPTGANWDLPFTLLAIALIAVGISYGMGMLAASRRNPRRRRAALPSGAGPGGSGAGRPGDDLFFVFTMPCLNEEVVIANSLRRLLALPGDNFVVLVIDDGSDDGTAAAVESVDDDRVWLMRRRAPHARQGKGTALNAAIAHLTSGGYLSGLDPARVIVVVMDADGHLDRDALDRVAPFFADPGVGAVQIGVRINNRFRSMLARMQDMEFVIYTEVFQRGRRHVGSVGLGGNGQFMRLSALQSFGANPWGTALAEDLDLGIRMIAAGWRNEYCAAVAVHQQGVEQLRRLIRQRSRWFQGHLQSWRVIPLVLRRVRGPAKADLLYHMTSPAVLLIASLLSASFLVSVANAGLEAARGENPVGWWLVFTYLLTFGPALIFGTVYWAKERANGLRAVHAIALAHLYVGYGMMWYAAGWWAVGRTLRGRTSWVKTDRVAELPLAGVAAGTAVAGVSAGHVPALSAAALSGAPGDGQPPASAPWIPAPASPVPAAGGPQDGAGAARPPAYAPAPRRRRGRAALITAAVVAAGAVAGFIADPGLRGAQPPPATWFTAFTGYGSTSVSGSGDSLVVSVAPERASTTNTSHAALVVSARSYGDFAETLRLRTVQQLRAGAAGRPRAWEVAWVVWHYTSDRRFYALTLENGGWVLSKEDPAYPGGQRFLASGLAPAFPPGAAYTVGVVQIGDRITVSADGQQLTRFTDTSHPYRSGTFGMYSEDSIATFDHIRIGQLTTGGK